MRPVVVILGLVLIVSGIITYAELQTPNRELTLVSGEAMTALAGSSPQRAFHLPADARVWGQLNTVSGGHGDIDFYVFDKSNYDLWSNVQTSVKYVYIYRANSGAQFSFRTDKEADYYFVFSNPVGGILGSDRSVNWSAWYEYKPYAPYALPILVSLVVVGILLVAVPYVLQLARKMEKLRTCPNCSQRVPIEKPICPHCGYDINKSIRCKYCHTFYDRSLPKCPHCGAHNK